MSGHLEELFRAKYPIVAIDSHEEDRVEQTLWKIGQEAGQKAKWQDQMWRCDLVVWSCTRGLVRQYVPAGKDTFAAESVDTQATMPDQVLAAIQKNKKDNVIYVLRDFQPYLSDPGIRRMLRDLAYEMPRAQCRRHVVLLGPRHEIPSDLEKEVVLLDFPLPDRTDLDQCLTGFQKSWILKGRPPLEYFEGTESRNLILEAGLGLSVVEFQRVLSRSSVRVSDIDPTIVHEEKKSIVRRNGILDFYDPEFGISDIGGLENLKAWLEKRAHAFGDKARKYGLPSPKGILLLGVPGVGKSMTAKALGAMWKRPTLRLDMGKVFGGLVGESESNIRSVLKTAEAVAPCILFLDELEKSLAGVGSSGETDSGVTARVFGSLLTWLQDKTAPVFVVATCNNVASLPPELLRRGRLDEIFFVDLPSSTAREEIFRIHLNRRGRNPDGFDLKVLAEASAAFSGAEIEQAVVSAMFDAFDDGGRETTTSDVLASVRETVPLSTTMREKLDGLRRWAQDRARFAAKKEDEPDGGVF